jgi:hypothetical protein
VTLPPRPELPADELAALTLVAEELLRPTTEDWSESVPAWRFSNRWFHSHPFANRRPHEFS